MSAQEVRKAIREARRPRFAGLRRQDPFAQDDTETLPAQQDAVTETMPAQPGADWRDDTITSFPAITDDAQPDAAQELVSVPDMDQACPCGSGKLLLRCDGRKSVPVPADVRAMLSCASGVTSRMWRTRVGNGQWDDIPALFDAAHAAIHFPALGRQRSIRGELAAARHDFAAVFGRHPGLLGDARLAAELHAIEARLAERLAEMRSGAETGAAA